MSLLCFATDFTLTPQEISETSVVTNAAYGAWVLVNDYFSWEKEWKNHQKDGETGIIVSAVFLYMKWHSVDGQEAKRLLRREIIAREENFIRAKEAFLARGRLTEKALQWLEVLDLVTAGNFAWSMTTARYHLDADDAYPRLRAAHQANEPGLNSDSLSVPISIRSGGAKRTDSAIQINEERSGNTDTTAVLMGSKATTPDEFVDGDQNCLPLASGSPSLYSYESVCCVIFGQELHTS